MNPHPHPISCPQCTFKQSIKELSTKELIKDVQDRIAQMKQMKTQLDSVGKPRIIDHKELIAAPMPRQVLF